MDRSERTWKPCCFRTFLSKGDTEFVDAPSGQHTCFLLVGYVQVSIKHPIAGLSRYKHVLRTAQGSLDMNRNSFPQVTSYQAIFPPV